MPPNSRKPCRNWSDVPSCPPTGKSDCRDAGGKTLCDLDEHDPRIAAVVNDSVGSSKLGTFQKAFPTRLVNVGIAEQFMVSVGAGLAPMAA